MLSAEQSKNFLEVQRGRVLSFTRPLRHSLANLTFASLLLTSCTSADFPQSEINTACTFLTSGIYNDAFYRHGFTVYSRLVIDLEVNPEAKLNPPFLEYRSMQNNLFYFSREGEEKFITQNPKFDDYDPDISPDSKKVVFARRGQSFMNEEGSWRSGFKGNEGLYILDLETGSEQIIAADQSEYINNEQPIWRPDGRKIAFVRRNWSQNPAFSDLFIMNSDGSNLENLTNIEEEFKKLQNRWDVKIVDLGFSPEGEMIAFRDEQSTFIADIAKKKVRKISPTSQKMVDQLKLWLNNTQLLVESTVVVSEEPEKIKEDRWFLINTGASGSKDLTEVCPSDN